jgi:hypothetical protein
MPMRGDKHMKRIDVDNSLYEIRDKIDKCNMEELEKLNIALEDVFKIKPVTLLYFNVKAKLLCEMGKYEEALETMKGKFNLCVLEPEYIEHSRILQRIYKAIGLETLYKQFCYFEYCLMYIFEQDEKYSSRLKEIEEKIINLEDNFLEYASNSKVEMKLSDAYFESWYVTEAVVMYALSIKKYNIDFKESLSFKERIVYETNYTFLLEQLLYKNGSFILVTNNNNYDRCMIIANALNKLNQKVFVITPPVSAEVEKKIDLRDTIEISMSNIEITDNGISKIRPVELLYNGKIIDNNTHLLLEELSKNTKNDFSILLGSGEFFSKLNNIVSLKKRFQRLSNFKGDFFENTLAFGYFGKYTSYISNIYGYDVQGKIDEPSEYEFSIVIPVRNSVESLRYTLQTCIEQREMNENDYEIVVSDNSPFDYKEIEKLVKELNSPKIKYFRTPRELPLSKSFEYAFLKAKGEFIFSIGADDAVLPWGLKVIREALKVLPYDDIVQWDRGFFVWPNNDRIISQAGQFLIPRPYNKANAKVEREKSIDNLIRLMYNPIQMYGMPMLYINSGFRRKYLKKLLDNTGRLWDGTAQDIYMGLVSYLTNETIPCLRYPITIAGMTASSAGINSNMGNRNNDVMIKRMIANNAAGLAVPYGNCFKFIHVDYDIGIFYSNFFRVLELDEKGIMKNIASQINWKKIFEMVAKGRSCDDVAFNTDIKSLRYSAYYHSDELGKWFDDNILENIMSPRTVERNKQKSYFEGFTTEGGLQLDARKFDITNVYEATKLFEKICNL